MRAWTSTLSPSVSATSRMLSPKRTTRRLRASWTPAAARIQAPMRDWTAGLLPVAGDGLARHAQPRHDVGELAVAVRRLVQVHEGHVDVGVGEVTTELGVEVQEGLLQRLQPGDPHLRRARRCASSR